MLALAVRASAYFAAERDAPPFSNAPSASKSRNRDTEVSGSGRFFASMANKSAVLSGDADHFVPKIAEHALREA